MATDYGFRPANVLAASVSRGNANDRELAASRAFYSEVLSKLASIPGVQSVGGIDYLPARTDFPVVAEAKAPAQSDSISSQVGLEVIAPGYLRTMGIPILDGQDFNEFDDQAHEKVSVVDQRVAAVLWPGRNPIGQQISLDLETAGVVDVVGPVRVFGPVVEGPPLVYRPLAQSGPPPGFSFVVSATSNPRDLASNVRSVIRASDPAQPVDMATMDDYLARTLQRPRGITGLLSILSILGLVLAIVGIYGLVSYSVATRTREFGIRIALGEEPGRIFLRSIGAGCEQCCPAPCWEFTLTVGG